MSAPDETPLRSVGAIPAGVVERLQERWISSAEQLVAAAATPGGVEALAEQAGVSADEVRHAVGAAREELAPEVLADLESPADPGELGTGALPPPDDDG